MIDIMLFLLVFFMISSISMIQANAIRVNLPAGQSAENDMKPHTVMITITSSGDILYEQDTKPTKDFDEKIKAKVAGDPDAVFVVRGDRKAPYENIAYALDALKAAGVQHISISVDK
jgi:Biopolymer transport protein